MIKTKHSMDFYREGRDKSVNFLLTANKRRIVSRRDETRLYTYEMSVDWFEMTTV